MKCKRLILASVALLAFCAARAEPRKQIVEITDTACSSYIRDTWNVVGDRLAIENGTIHLCANECKDPRLHGIDVTEGLSQKFNLKKGRFAEMLKAQCKSNSAEKSWPEKCQSNDLAIFKVMIPFTGNPSQICFCENHDGSPEMALCRKIDDSYRLVSVLAHEPLKRTLDSACQVTAMSGSAVACLCSQRHPTIHQDYIRCLREKSTNAAPGPPRDSESENAPSNR